MKPLKKRTLWTVVALRACKLIDTTGDFYIFEAVAHDGGTFDYKVRKKP